MGRHGKLKWEDVYADYKKHFPKSSKKALGFSPYDYATILIYLPERVRATYNYDTKKLTKLKREAYR